MDALGILCADSILCVQQNSILQNNTSSAPRQPGYAVPRDEEA
jgi:hypothetical protein